MYFQKINFNLSIAFVIALVVFFTVFNISVTFAQSDDILLNHDITCFQKKINGNKERPAVMFTHESHMEQFECLECHHKYEDGENVLDESDLEEDNPDIACCTCHNSKTKIDLEDAFHNLCISCHNDHTKKFWIPRKGIQWKAFVSVDEQQGPTLCGECHMLENPVPPQ